MFRHVRKILDKFTPNLSTAMIPRLPILENIEKQWKETMFPQQCSLVSPELNNQNITYRAH
jgi:hypothetical protein